MTAIRALAIALVLLSGSLGDVAAQSGKPVRVSVEFRQSSTQSRDALAGSGGVIVTDRGERSSVRAGVDTTRVRVQTSSAILTSVSDGLLSMLMVASQIPHSQVTYYRHYCTGVGYVGGGIEFKDSGTSLKVASVILPGNQVKV